MTLRASDNPPSCYPEHLFQDMGVGNDKLWRVARTKSRQEKSLAWDLRSKGLPYYLPLVSMLRESGGRMRSSMLPLFSGYLFFKGNDYDRYWALSTGRVAQVIEVAEQQGLTAELSNLNTAIQLQKDLRLCDFFACGGKVLVIAGPFSGIEGMVKMQKGKTRLVLKIQAIRQAVSFDIGMDQVRPL